MSIPMRIPPFSNDPFGTLLGLTLPVLSIVMFLPSIYRTTYRITKEKEMRTKESMYMMGLKPMPYWLSWFVYYLIMTTALVLCSWAFMALIFSHTSMFVLFLIFYTYGISLFGMIMTVQALFSSARVAAIVASTFYLVLMFPFMLTQRESENSQSLLWGIASLPPSGIGLTCQALVTFETSRVRIDTDSWGISFKGWSVRNGVVM